MARQSLRGAGGCRRISPRGSRKAHAPTGPTEKRATANTDQWGRRGEERTHSHHPKPREGRRPPEGGKGTHGDEKNPKKERKKRRGRDRLVAASQRQRRRKENSNPTKV